MLTTTNWTVINTNNQDELCFYARPKKLPPLNKKETDASKTLRQFKKRLIAYNLDLFILVNFREIEFDLFNVRELMRKKFSLKLGRDILCLTLCDMEKEGLLETFTIGKINTYKVTAKGMHQIGVLIDSKRADELFNQMINNITWKN